VKWGGSSPCSPITEEEVREGLKQRSIEPLQPEDIANAVGQPQRVSVNEILIRPTQQAHRIG
jgi:NADP-dependent 3-hydroxy acid dehydrogenase YdfG